MNEEKVKKQTTIPFGYFDFELRLRAKKSQILRNEITHKKNKIKHIE